MLAALLLASSWSSMGIGQGWTSDSSEVVFQAYEGRQVIALVVDGEGRVQSRRPPADLEPWVAARKFSGIEIVSEQGLEGILQIEGGFTVAVRESAGSCPQVMLVVQRRKVATDAPPKGMSACSVQSNVEAQVSPDGARLAVAWEVLRSGKSGDTQRGYHAVVRK